MDFYSPGTSLFLQNHNRPRSSVWDLRYISKEELMLDVNPKSFYSVITIGHLAEELIVKFSKSWNNISQMSYFISWKVSVWITPKSCFLDRETNRRLETWALSCKLDVLPIWASWTIIATTRNDTERINPLLKP